MNERKMFRCAIYTRKSTDHGLEQDFNSLDAQREAAEAFLRPSRVCWICIFRFVSSLIFTYPHPYRLRSPSLSLLPTWLRRRRSRVSGVKVDVGTFVNALP